jgi:hypothetical protein
MQKFYIIFCINIGIFIKIQYKKLNKNRENTDSDILGTGARIILNLTFDK